MLIGCLRIGRRTRQLLRFSRSRLCVLGFKSKNIENANLFFFFENRWWSRLQTECSAMWKKKVFKSQHNISFLQCSVCDWIPHLSVCFMNRGKWSVELYDINYSEIWHGKTHWDEWTIEPRVLRGQRVNYLSLKEELMVRGGGWGFLLKWTEQLTPASTHYLPCRWVEAGGREVD